MTAWEDPDLVAEFLVEAEEHLDEADSALLGLEPSPNDGELQRRLNGALHTVKGMASYVDFAEIGRLCHVTESLVGSLAVQSPGQVAASIDVVFQAVTLMRGHFAEVSEALDAGGDAPDPRALRELAQRIKGMLPAGQRHAG